MRMESEALMSFARSCFGSLETVTSMKNILSLERDTFRRICNADQPRLSQASKRLVNNQIRIKYIKIYIKQFVEQVHPVLLPLDIQWLIMGIWSTEAHSSLDQSRHPFQQIQEWSDRTDRIVSWIMMFYVFHGLPYNSWGYLHETHQTAHLLPIAAEFCPALYLSRILCRCESKSSCQATLKCKMTC